MLDFMFQTSECCSGFYGYDCLPCPGGYQNPCNGHGKVGYYGYNNYCLPSMSGFYGYNFLSRYRYQNPCSGHGKVGYYGYNIQLLALRVT